MKEFQSVRVRPAHFLIRGFAYPLFNRAFFLNRLSAVIPKRLAAVKSCCREFRDMFHSLKCVLPLWESLPESHHNQIIQSRLPGRTAAAFRFSPVIFEPSSKRVVYFGRGIALINPNETVEVYAL